MSFLDHLEGELAKVALALHEHWTKLFHSERETIMAAIEDLQTNVATIAAASERTITELGDLKAKIETLGAEDPRIAALADQTKAIADKLSAAVLAPVVFEAPADPSTI